MPKKKVEPLLKKRSGSKVNKKGKGSPAATHKDHAEGANKCIGSDERMIEHCRFALKMRMRGFPMWQIAEKMRDEFDMNLPLPQDVCRWINKARMESIGEIKALGVEFAAQAYMELEQIKCRWMPVAVQEGLRVNRMTMSDGEMVPVLDENAYDEGLKAANAVVKIIMAQSKILSFTSEHTGDGPQAETAVQEWFMEFLQRGSIEMSQSKRPIHKLIAGVTIDAESVPSSQVLEVDHGITEFEEL